MIFTVLFTLVALYASYRVFFVLENRIGTTDGSLVIIAAIFCLGAVNKGMKMCPCRSKGCGCGGGCACGKENCDCGDKGGCDCGHDHGDASAPHQH
jgi:hypothetical protein